jgi:hypothetical protein
LDDIPLQLAAQCVEEHDVGWLRMGNEPAFDEDAETAEVTAWLRTVMAWIGETALIRLTPVAAGMPETTYTPAHVEVEGFIAPVVPLPTIVAA